MRNITPPTYVSGPRKCAGAIGKSPKLTVLRCGILQLWAHRRSSLLVAVLLIGSVAGADEPNGTDTRSAEVSAETSPVQTTLIAEVRPVTQDDAQSEARRPQRLIPAAVVSQGEVVFYTVQIRNPTSAPVRDVVVVQRIPANTTYVADSAAGPSAEITFSVDGGQTFWPEKELVVAKAPAEARKATPQDYTHVRWQLRNALAPGAVALARFQAVFR
jgi:uncharacterized repeat protein (TIGR01451 family)